MEKGNSVEARSQLCFLFNRRLHRRPRRLRPRGPAFSSRPCRRLLLGGGGGGATKGFDAPVRLFSDISSIVNISQCYLTGLSMFNWALTGQ